MTLTLAPTPPQANTSPAETGLEARARLLREAQNLLLTLKSPAATELGFARIALVIRLTPVLEVVR